MNRKMTKKTTIAAVISALFILVTVNVSFADSFINDSSIRALENFKFGGSESIDKKEVHNNLTAAKNWEEGDSFVNDSVLKQLENFKFGETLEIVKTKGSRPLFLEKGDSFVTASTLKQLETIKFGSVDKPNLKLAVPSGI